MDIECAQCGVTMSPSEGCEFEPGDWCWACLDSEVERLRSIIYRCGICRDLLAGKRTVVQKIEDDINLLIRESGISLARLRQILQQAAADAAEKCDHPWHNNPGLITGCPECGAGKAGGT